jgi:hypothetical protein
MKEVAELVKKFNDIDLNRRILNLENEVLDLSREKRRAEEKVEELERTLKIKDEIVFRNNEYYVKKDGREDEGPYCTVCWDRDGKLVRLHEGSFGSICPACVQARTSGASRARIYNPSAF